MDDEKVILIVIASLAKEWVDAIDRDASWDAWDHHYKKMKYELLPKLERFTREEEEA